MTNQLDVTQAFLDLPMEKRARVWCALNRFEWPEELAEFKPEKWDAYDHSLDLRFTRMELAKELWRVANEHTTIRDCLREWNRGRMTDLEFELWWPSGRHHWIPNS